MRLSRNLTFALCLAAVTGNIGIAQNAFTLQAPAPNSVAFTSATITGNHGNGTYYYWVIANYPTGASFPTGPAVAQFAPNPLTGSNFVTISWVPVGATTYDVVESPTSSFPAPCSACKVGTTAGTSVADNGGARTSYTFTPAGAALATMSLNNITDVQPFVDVQVANSVSNQSYRLGLVSGPTTSGHCTQFSTAGTVVDAGSACGGGGGGAVSSVFTRTGAVVANTGDYTVSQVTGAAPLASPTFTGIPAGPTATVGTNTTQLATTAFVLANAGSGAVSSVTAGPLGGIVVTPTTGAVVVDTTAFVCLTSTPCAPTSTFDLSASTKTLPFQRAASAPGTPTESQVYYDNTSHSPNYYNGTAFVPFGNSVSVYNSGGVITSPKIETFTGTTTSGGSVNSATFPSAFASPPTCTMTSRGLSGNPALFCDTINSGSGGVCTSATTNTTLRYYMGTTGDTWSAICIGN